MKIEDFIVGEKYVGNVLDSTFYLIVVSKETAANITVVRTNYWYSDIDKKYYSSWTITNQVDVDRLKIRPITKLEKIL